MSYYGLREVVRNFQSQAALSGRERTFLLGRIVAASIGYSAICPVGEIEDSSDYYNRIVREQAEEIVSAINEIQLINPNDVMTKVRDIWMTRFNVVNSPMFTTDFVEYQRSMTVCDGVDLTDKYNAWVGSFSKVIQSIIRG